MAKSKVFGTFADCPFRVEFTTSPNFGKLCQFVRSCHVFGTKPEGGMKSELSLDTVVIIVVGTVKSSSFEHLLTSTKRPAKAMHHRNHIRSHRSSYSSRSGFTLLELLLVLAILVMIIGIGVTNFSGVQDGANQSATEVILNGLKDNVKMYKIRMNGLPESLEMLRDGPSDAAKKAKWVSPIIDEIPKDSWDNDLEYSVNGGTFELRSSGLDQQMNTDDDITVEGS